VPDPQEELPDYNPEESEPHQFDDAQSAMHHMAKKVRAFMADEQAVNELLGKREFSWDSIFRAVEAALYDWCSTPPVGEVKLVVFPRMARHLLYVKSAAWLLRNAANPQARNQLSYSDQGWSVQESDKAPMYMQLALTLEQQYEDKKIRFKAAQNAERMWGGVHSEYSAYDGFNIGFDDAMGSYLW